MLTFLHISDLHFTTEDSGTQFDQDARLRGSLLNDLGKDDRKAFDGIFVTGDIARHGQQGEFARAKAWLEDLRKATGSPPEAIYVVPGNHDVNRASVKKDSSLWELHQSLRQAMSHEDRCHKLDSKLQDSFDFLTAMAEYRAFAAEYGCPTSRDAVAWTQVLDGRRLLEDGTPVRLHGLNTALISDGEDARGNLLLGSCQFHHFDSDPNYVNIALCHHPHAWLLDGAEANDYFRSQAQIVLSGHDHSSRCYTEGGSLRVSAGAVHPERREPGWEPCYHVLRLSVETGAGRQLIASLETRAWRDREKRFGPAPDATTGSRCSEFRIQLPPRTMPTAARSDSGSGVVESRISSSPEKIVAATPTNDALIAARRKLIVHFFRLGTIDRYKVVMDAGVWEDGDDAFDGQARWARVFDRAERADKFRALWAAVALKDETLSGQPNPFSAGK